MTGRNAERSTLTPEEVLGLMLAQIRALHATNAALIAAMRGMVDMEVDMEQVRSRALGMFPDPVADASAIAHVNAMMGPTSPPKPAAEPEPKERFRVIEGGGEG